MSFIPDAVIFSLESIKALVQSIRKTASRVKVNRHQCKTLSDRITRITGLLCADTPKNQLHSALIAIIQDFSLFLTKCDIFVKKFENDGWFFRIKNNCNYHREFKRLNEELCHFSQDLQLSIQLHGLFVPAQDELDAQRDSKEIEQIITRTNLLKQSTVPNGSPQVTRIPTPTSITRSPALVQRGTNSPLIHQSTIIKLFSTNTSNLHRPLSSRSQIKI